MRSFISISVLYFKLEAAVCCASNIKKFLDSIYLIISNKLIGNSKNTSIKSYKELITFVEDRPGHDRRYAIDPTKIETELNWKPVWNFEEALVKTVEWYINKFIGYHNAM